MAVQNKTKILLIEDNPGDAHLVTIYLKEGRLKHELFTSETLFEADEIIEESKPDVVLLDLSLPDTSGFKTLTSFREKYPNLPVIVMTGLNDEIIGNQSVKAGAQDYLVKGEFDGKLLSRSIRYSLQRHKTQRKLEITARNLAISEKRFLEAQQLAHFGNFEVDLVNNSMVWTEEIFKILDFIPNSIKPSLSDYLSYCHFEDRKMVEEFFDDAAKDGQRHSIEHRLLLNGHTVKYVQLHAKIFYDEYAEKLLLVGGMQDITERKISEKLLIEKNISTRNSKIKEEILEDMSFHVRTPLASTLNLSYLLSNTKLDSQQKELMDNLMVSMEDLAISANNLMNFSLMISEKLKTEEQELDLEDFMHGIEKIMSLKSKEKNIRVKYYHDQEISPKFLADGNKLNQVLYNLIDNSIKFTEKGGMVDVGFKYDKLDENQAELIIDIQDNGRGIKSHLIGDLLNADQLLSKELEETDEKPSMGLAIVVKLIKTLKGQLHIESKENHGSLFRVTIPIKPKRRSLPRTSDKPNEPLKILLVEDHFLNQMATRKVLTGWSDLVTVDIAENGLVGVEKYREYGYDIILMDLQMPVMNGFESTTKIRERSDVPIIALTAASSKSEQDKCIETGMNDYISKPFKPEELFTKSMDLIQKKVPNISSRD